MGNGIASRQNQISALNYLSAQRSLYRKAKATHALQLFLSVILICGLSIITLILKATSLLQQSDLPAVDISSFVAVVSVLVTIFEPLLLTRRANSLKQKAASVQELFDTTVLLLPWNPVAVANKPDKEDVLSWGRSLRGEKVELDRLRNWYSPRVDELPIAAARIVCQRSNLWWDAELRRLFVTLLASTTSLLFALILLSAVFEGVTLRNFFLSILFPSLPVISYTVRQWLDNQSTIKELARLKHSLNSLWDDLIHKRLDDEQLAVRSRAVQDQIFLLRKTSPLVFDWVYNLKKTKQEDGMHYAVDAMIEELQSVA